MKGVGRLRPPKAKYNVTWDPSTVLALLESWDSETVTLKLITLKTVSLLALVTSQRVQTLVDIKLSNIVWTDPIQITLNSVLKTTSIKNPNPILILPLFHNERICPVTTLKCYVERTKPLRGAIDSLFISFVPPYHPVSQQTISRWLCNILSLANIDVSKFSGHSYRHASTSKAENRGISTDTIFRMVGWTSNSGVFARYYKKPVDDRANFAHAILNN